MWEINTERRAAPRRRVKIEFRVLLVAMKTSADGEEQMLPLIGSTQDLSDNGIALLVSAKSMSVLYTLGQNYTLQLVLTLPVGPVELEVTPARYAHLNEGNEGSRILIGTRITKISDEDRARFNEYLRSLE
jgi:hypothetical protein